MKTKICSKCKQTKDIGEFSKNKDGKDGLRSQCKSCISELNKIYRQKNKEKIKARYQENKEKIAERDKARYQENKEKILERKKAWYQENKEEIAEKKKAYRQKNKEKIAKHKKKYYQENKKEIAKRKKAYRQENKEKIAERQKAYQQKNKEKIAERNKAYYQENKETIAERGKAYRQENKEKINKRSNKRYKNDPVFKLNILYRRSLKRAFDSIIKKKKCDSLKTLDLETYEEFADHLSKQFYDHPITGEKMTFENHGAGDDCWQIDHKIPLLTAKTKEDVIRLSRYTNLQPLWTIDHLKKTASDINSH